MQGEFITVTQGLLIVANHQRMKTNNLPTLHIAAQYICLYTGISMNIRHLNTNLLSDLTYFQEKTVANVQEEFIKLI